MSLVQQGKELQAIHKILRSPFYPESLDPNVHYMIQADDHDGIENSGWLGVTCNADVAINLHGSLELPGTGVGFRNVGGDGGDHPLVHNATYWLAEAIRLDYDYSEVVCEVGRSQELRTMQELLYCMPWLPTLNVDTYTVQSDNVEHGGPEGWLSVTFTELNDVRIEIDGNEARFRLHSGGGHKLRVVGALYVMAEAIRLEQS